MYNETMNAEDLFQKAEQCRHNEKLADALDFYNKAIQACSETEEKIIIAESFHMIGVVLLEMEEYEQSLKYLDQSENCYELIHDSDMVGAVLRDKAAVMMELKDYARAEVFIKESIRYLEKGESMGHLGISEVRLGSLYRHLEELDQAEALIHQGIAHIKQSQDRFFESSAYYQLALVFQDRKELFEARTSAERALRILEHISRESMYVERKKEIRNFIESLNKEQ